VAWQTLSSRDKGKAWGVFHQASFVSFTEDVLYNVAEVALDEGPRLLTTLVAVENDTITMAMPIEMVCDEVTVEVTRVKFRPLRRGVDQSTGALHMAHAAHVTTCV
jgi:uncharacterized OB-fold protein